MGAVLSSTWLALRVAVPWFRIPPPFEPGVLLWSTWVKLSVMVPPLAIPPAPLAGPPVDMFSSTRLSLSVSVPPWFKNPTATAALGRVVVDPGGVEGEDADQAKRRGDDAATEPTAAHYCGGTRDANSVQSGGALVVQQCATCRAEPTCQGQALQGQVAGRAVKLE